MALFRSLGLRHICREPSVLWVYVSKDTQSIGQETGAMTPLVTMSSSVFSICSQYSMGTLQWVCCMGRPLGSVLMVYIPDMLPVVSKELGNACFNAFMSETWAVKQGEVSRGNLP